MACNSWPAQGNIGRDPKAHRPGVAARRPEFGKDCQSEVSTGRCADRRRRRQASARFGSQSGACRTRNRPFPDRRLAASRRRIRLRVGDSRRDRRVTCAQAAPAGSSAKPAPEKNTQHFPLPASSSMLVDPEEFLRRRYSSRFQRPTALAVRTAGACGLRLLSIAHGREFEIFSHAEAIERRRALVGRTSRGGKGRLGGAGRHER